MSLVEPDDQHLERRMLPAVFVVADPVASAQSADVGVFGHALAHLAGEVLQGDAFASDHLARVIEAALGASMTDALQRSDVLFDAFEIERFVLAWGASPARTAPSNEGLQHVLSGVVMLGIAGPEGPDSPGELYSLLRRLPLHPGQIDRPPGLPPLRKPDGTTPLHEIRMPWELIDLCELMFQDALELRVFPTRVNSVQHACVGQEMFVMGEYLGSAAWIKFTGVDKPIQATVWSGDLISAIVPVGAQPGTLEITVERDSTKCGRRHVIRVPTSASFTGGVPAVPVFRIDGEVVNDIAMIPPLTAVAVEWEASAHTTNTVQIDPQAAVVSTQAGPNSGLLVLSSDGAASPVIVKVVSVGSCATVQGVLQIDVKPLPELAIVGIEVTQAVQRFDLQGNGPRNTSPLVARRRTVVRAYVTGATAVSAPGGGGVPIAGELTVRSGSRTLGVFPNVAHGRGSSSLAYDLSRLDREEEEHGLWFEPPWTALDGTVTFEARAWARGLPLTLRQPVTDSTTVAFRKVKHLRVGLVPVTHEVVDISGSRTRLPSRKPSTDGLSAVFPMAEDSPMFTWLPELDAGSVQLVAVTPKSGTNEARDEAKMAEMLPINALWNSVEKSIGRYSGAPWKFDRVVGVLPVGTPVLEELRMNDDTRKKEWQTLGGWLGSEIILSWFDPIPLAHELLHTIGIRHAACRTTSRDPRLASLIDGKVEDVATVVAYRRASSGHHDVMSYCDPRSISIATTELAIAQLDRLP